MCQYPVIPSFTILNYKNIIIKQNENKALYGLKQRQMTEMAPELILWSQMAPNLFIWTEMAPFINASIRVCFSPK